MCMVLIGVKRGDRKAHFKNVVICDDKIVASYIGEDWNNNNGASVFHVFNIAGDYLKTWMSDGGLITFVMMRKINVS